MSEDGRVAGGGAKPRRASVGRRAPKVTSGIEKGRDLDAHRQREVFADSGSPIRDDAVVGSIEQPAQNKNSPALSDRGAEVSEHQSASRRELGTA